MVAPDNASNGETHVEGGVTQTYGYDDIDRQGRTKKISTD
jgi:hypothetical protein